MSFTGFSTDTDAPARMSPAVAIPRIKSAMRQLLFFESAAIFRSMFSGCFESRFLLPQFVTPTKITGYFGGQSETRAIGDKIKKP
jgi:hypothetical protein